MIKGVLRDDLKYDHKILATALNIKCTLEGEEYNFTLDDKVPLDTALTLEEGFTPDVLNLMLQRPFINDKSQYTQYKKLSECIKEYYHFDYFIKTNTNASIQIKDCSFFLETASKSAKIHPLAQLIAQAIYYKAAKHELLNDGLRAICTRNPEAFSEWLPRIKHSDLREIENAIHVIGHNESLANIMQEESFNSIPLYIAIESPLHYINKSLPETQKTLFIACFGAANLPREEAIRDILNNKNINEAILYGHGLKEITQNEIIELLMQVQQYQIDKTFKKVIIVIEQHGSLGSPELSIIDKMPQLGERMSVIIANCYGAGALSYLEQNKSLIANNEFCSLSYDTVTRVPFINNIYQNFDLNDILGTIMRSYASLENEYKSVPMFIGTTELGVRCEEPKNLADLWLREEAIRVNHEKSVNALVVPPGKLAFNNFLLRTPEKYLVDVIKNGFIPQRQVNFMQKKIIPLIKDVYNTKKNAFLLSKYHAIEQKNLFMHDIINECVAKSLMPNNTFTTNENSTHMVAAKIKDKISDEPVQLEQATIDDIINECIITAIGETKDTFDNIV